MPRLVVIFLVCLFALLGAGNRVEAKMLAGQKTASGVFANPPPDHVWESEPQANEAHRVDAVVYGETASGRPFFANGDPVNGFDPDGRFSKDIWGNPYPVLIPRPAEQTAWDAAVDSGGRYAGAVVDTLKFWKWPQGIADFAGTHVASAFYEPAEYFNPFSKTNVDYVKWQFGTADGWGGINGSLLVGSLATVRPTSGPTSTQSSTVRVTSWADDGTTPDLNPGRWVQLGEATPVNYFKTGLPGPKVHLEASFPYVKIEGSKASFSNSVSSSVPAASLVWPPGLESWKGILGQRQIKTTE